MENYGHTRFNILSDPGDIGHMVLIRKNKRAPERKVWVVFCPALIAFTLYTKLVERGIKFYCAGSSY